MSSGVLTNHMVWSGGVIDGMVTLNDSIDCSELILTSVRVECDSDANAMAERIIYVEIPFLNASNLKDSTNFSRLPILLHEYDLTHYSPNLRISLHQPIPKEYHFRVFSRSGALCTVVKSITLQFNYLN